MATRKKKPSYTIKVVAGYGWKAATIRRTTRAGATREAQRLSKRAGEACVFHGKALLACYDRGAKVRDPYASEGPAFAGSRRAARRQGASLVCDAGEGGPDCLPL